MSMTLARNEILDRIKVLEGKVAYQTQQAEMFEADAIEHREYAAEYNRLLLSYKEILGVTRGGDAGATA